MLRRLPTCLCLALLGALLTHRLAEAQPLVTIRNPSSDYYQDGFGRALAELGGNLLVGTSNQGYGDAYLYDPLTGALLQTFLNPGTGSFGTSIASVGGNALVGSSPSAAFLFDGATGALLRTFPSPVGTEARFGLSVAALGSNVLVGAPGGFCCDADPGAVYLFDGATGVLLRTFQAPTPTTTTRSAAVSPPS